MFPNIVVICVFAVFVSCCSNAIFLELLIKDDPGSGHIITFAQFLFISVEGFLFTAKFGTVSPVVPIGKYVFMVAMFFSVSILNNYALSFHIAMPLHMVFRAGSLVANMLLSLIILKRRYKASKYVAVAMVTAGIATCTIVSGQQVHGATDTSARWLTGIGILAVAQLLAAGLGVYQEILYAQHGKHPRESLFYSHALPLPIFVLLSANIALHADVFTQSPPLTIPGVGLAPPRLWLYLAGNVLTQYAGVRAVYVLTTECASLSVTLVITLRKFLSLLISIFYFGNPFTVYHWLGTALVFSGTFLFVDGFGIASRLSTRHPEKSD